MAEFDCLLAPRVKRVARDAGRGGYGAEADGDATRYQVALVDGPGDELAFVRAVRTIARITLAEALDIHAYAQCIPGATLVAGVPFATASQIVCALEAASIHAGLVPSTIATPMVCRPRADEVRAWVVALPAQRTRPSV